MRRDVPLIGRGTLTPRTLAGQVAVVTGAGRGIGHEAARALAWLGARVVLAELDRKSGLAAARRICEEAGGPVALFVQTDVADERSVARLVRQATPRLGPVDIVLNNAAATPVGAVHRAPIADWDLSYRVNVRGPVLLARAFLPGMIERQHGVFVCVSSSGAAPYMGPYEVMKTAQVELGNTLAAELEESGVIAFTIGPGLVRTPGAEATIPKIAALYGKTVDEFYAMSQAHIISAEAAGAGFAAAIALASQWRGQEIGAVQALRAAGIDWEAPTRQDAAGGALTPARCAEALALCREVRATLAEQSAGWAERPLFERQWVVRDFRNHAGMPVERWLDLLACLEERLAAGDGAGALAVGAPIDQLVAYYEHMLHAARGYLQKDPEKLAEAESALAAWKEAASKLAQMLEV
jgi:NAD(P)-dependent dehydrogenase (short-subunit alcohol dehydrogenase family)